MLIYSLPLPPSVNAMFANRGVNGVFGEAKKSGRIGQQRQRGRIVTSAYRAWRHQAGMHLLVQGPLRKIAGPVAVRIIISDKACGDLDNRCKAVLDLLVHHEIIEDDCRSIVRKILLEWGDVEGAQVEITEQPDWTERRNVAKRNAA